MSGAPSRRDPPPLLPGARRPSPFVTVAITIVSMIVAVDLVAATFALGSLRALPGRLGGSVTVATTGGGLESADAAAARVAEVLSQTSGIAGARVLEPDTTDDLAGRLMAGDALPDAIGGGGATTSRLVRADFAAGSPLRATDIPALLGRQGLRVLVDDHDPWTGPIERAALAAGVAVASIPLLALIAVWAIIVWRAFPAVARRRERLSLLIHLGASEPTLARPLSDGLILAVVAGSAVGAAAVALLAATLAWAPAAAIWLAARGTQVPMLTGVDLVALLAWPAAATLVAALAARRPVIAALRELG